VTRYDLSVILYTCLFMQAFFFHYFHKLKNQRYHFEENALMCGVCIFKKFLDVYFLPYRFFFELRWSCCEGFLSVCLRRNSKKKPISMPKCMHDTSMDRGFSAESIGMKSTHLCAMNGRVYTPASHKEILIFLKEG